MIEKADLTPDASIILSVWAAVCVVLLTWLVVGMDIAIWFDADEFV